MTSSAEEILNLLMQQYRSEEDNRSNKKTQKNSSDQFSYENIVKMINLQTDEPLQVEGNFLVNLFGANRFFTFDNHSIEQLPYGKN